MKWNPRWLLLPLVAGLLIVLGPLAMQGGTKNATGAAPTTAPTTPATEPDTGTNRIPSPPRTPDLWQVVSTLLGVLVLGGVGIFMVRRLRQNPRAGTTSVMHLRQSVRLSARLAVHVVEFDDRLLLVGEGERGVQLIHSGRLPDPAADMAEVAARTIGNHSQANDDDDGATPKDLLIPRPATPKAARPAPRPVARNPALTDFRALLQKAGKA